MQTNVFKLLVCAGLLLSVNLPASGQPTGTVVIWGANWYRKDRNLLSDYYTTGPVEVSCFPLSNAVLAAGGATHGLAIRKDSTVVAWGASISGSILGYAIGDTCPTSGVVRLRDQILSNATAVAAGHGFSLALKSDGTVVGWGENRAGQVNIPAGLSNVVGISAGYAQGLALLKNGTITNWGSGNPPPPGLTNVMAVAAGGEYGWNLALHRDGTVSDWRVVSVEYSSTTPQGLSNVVAIAAGSGHSLALMRDGTVMGWGANWMGQATGVPNPAFPRESTGTVTIAGMVLSNVVKIAAGFQHSMALRQDGSVVVWGHPQGMQLSAPSDLNGVVGIAAGDRFCLAITTNTAYNPGKLE